MNEFVGSSAPHARNPRGQGDRLRETLLDAATDLLADLQDVQALSVRAVTARAGVTPTALYLHFRDKEDLLDAVKDRCFGELRRYVTSGAPQQEDPRARLEAMGRAYLRFAAERPGYYRVLFHTAHGDPTAAPPEGPPAVVGPGWPPAAEQALDDLISLVARCLPPNTPAEPVATMLWAGLHGYAGLRRSMREYPFPADEDYVRRLLNAHLDPR